MSAEDGEFLFAPSMPLPCRAFTPGEANPPHAAHPPSETWEGPLFWHGWDLLAHGYPWEAHEVWEHLWRHADGSSRSWLQGLIRLAAALVKARTRNARAVEHHFAGALGHWRSIPTGELSRVAGLVPLLESWLTGATGAMNRDAWLDQCRELKAGEPGPILLPPEAGALGEALLRDLQRVSQPGTASSSDP